MISAETVSPFEAAGAVIALQDGSHCRIRRVCGNDEPLLRAMFARCDPADVYLRIFAAMKQFPEVMAARLAHADPALEIALVATPVAVESREIFGVAHLICEASHARAGEFDAMVRSDLKGHGYGYVLMTSLIREAVSRALAEITGYILMENHAMLQMVAELGFMTERMNGGVAEVRLTLAAL